MLIGNFSERRNGFTIIELLVVIAIIGALVALLFPAIQSAREAARRIQCRNKLKQISVGLLNHELSQGHFPYGGWGHEWVGVPGRGSQERQPGGWAYSTLPYLELNQLHQLGRNPEDDNFGQFISQRLSTPVCLFSCPTRRPCQLWRVNESIPYLSHPKPAGFVSAVARSDYAINAGGNHVYSWPGPEDFLKGDDPKTDWPDAKSSSGICHLRFGVEARQIEDGLSNTYLVGEKFLNPAHYADGESRGDNETLFSGYASDLHRFTRLDLQPLLDTPAKQKLGSPGFLRFGSAHPAGYQMAMCDGSVRLLSYDISAEIHFSLGHRHDMAAQ